jgi:hypothetical protein
MKPLVFYQFSYFVQARPTDSVALLYRKGMIGRLKLDVWSGSHPKKQNFRSPESPA